MQMLMIYLAGAKSNFTLYLNDTMNSIVRYEVQVIDADKSLYEFDTNKKNQTTSTSKQDDGTGYVAGDNEALIAINDGDPTEYLPYLGGQYPPIVNGEPDSWVSDYQAGYIDRLKQEGYY